MAGNKKKNVLSFDEWAKESGYKSQDTGNRQGNVVSYDEWKSGVKKTQQKNTTKDYAGILLGLKENESFRKSKNNIINAAQKAIYNKILTNNPTTGNRAADTVMPINSRIRDLDRQQKSGKTNISDVLQLTAQHALDKNSGKKTVTVKTPAMEKSTAGMSKNGQQFTQMVKNAINSGKGMDEIKAAYAQALDMYGQETALETMDYVNAMMAEYRGEKQPEEKTYTQLTRDFKTQSMLDQLANPNSKAQKYIQEKEAKEKESAALWAKANQQTPYEQYKAAEWDKRGEAANEMRSLENVRAYNNAHPNNNWGLLPERRKEAESEIAKSNTFLEQAEKDKEAIFNIYNGTSTIKAYRGRELPPYMVKPADYDTNKRKYDEKLYDFYYGDGEYNRIINYGQNQENELMEQRLDALWNDLGNVAEEVKKAGYNYTDFNADIQLEQSNRRYYEDRLKEIGYEENAEENYNDLIDKYIGHQTHSKFIPEYDRGQDAYSNMTELERGVQTSDVHRIYSLLGGGKEWQTWNAQNNNPATSEYSYALMMTDGSDGSFDEVGLFMDLYNEAVSEGREPTEAKAFLDGLQTALQWRYNNTVENINYAEVARQVPVLGSAASVMAQQADTLLAIPRTIAGWLGDESVKNPNGAWYAPTRMRQGVQNEIAENIGGIGGKIYQNSMNSINNIINALTVGGKTKLAQEVMGLGKFFLQVYQESTYENLQKTDYNTASWLGALDGLMETVEELLPYDTMLNSGGKSIVRAYIDSMLSEGLEELTGATAGEKIKGLITGRDSEQKRADEILHDGGFFDANGKWVELSKDKTQKVAQAEAQAFREFIDNAKESALGGAFGGGFSGAFGTIENAIGTTRTGRTILQPGNTVKGRTGLERTVDVALGMKGTASEQIAKKIRTRELSGKKVSNYSLGKLAITMSEETNEQYRGIVEETTRKTVQEQLERAGVNKDAAAEAADVIARSIKNDGKMSAEDQAILAKNKAAAELWESYHKPLADEVMELRENIRENTKDQRSVANMLGDMIGKNAKATSVIAAEVDRSNRESESNEGAVDNLAKRRWDIMSERFANAAKEALKNNPELQKSKSYLDDVVKLRLSAYSLSDIMPETNLDDETAQKLYDEAKAEFEEEDAKRFVQQIAVKPGKGSSMYDGAEYGTEEWNQKVKEDKSLTKRQKLYMRTVSEIAQVMGFDVNIINRAETTESGTDMTEVFGSENEGTGAITINIAGLNEKGGEVHNAVVTIAHEMTHWLEQNSKENYKRLRQFLFDELRDKGVNIEQVLVGSMENQNTVLNAKSGESLDLFGAVAELVARSSEGLFTSTEMRNRLQQQAPGVFGAVKNFVRGFIAKLDEAIKGIDSSMSQEAQILKDKVDEIAKVWLSGYDEALGRNAEEGGEATKGERFSTRQKSAEDLDAEYAEAVANKDWRKAENMLLEKMQRTEGITGYRAPHFYNGEHQNIAKAIKTNENNAISRAVEDMAPMIPDNAVLIPMPPHEGKVKDDTDTYILAQALSKATGRPVVVALESDYHESRYKAKASGNNNVKADTMGFRQVAEIPEGAMPVYIDNMVGGGQTAMAAKNALGRGITLAYAQSSRSKSQGVKDVTVTYDNNGNLIPLSQRMDPNNKSWKYSTINRNNYIADRITRQNKAKNLLKNTDTNAALTEKEAIDLIRNAGYTTLEQWIHNEKGKKGKTVTKKEILSFIQKDEAEMRKGSQSVTDGWRNLAETNPRIKTRDIRDIDAIGGKIVKTADRIFSVLFGKGNKTEVKNKDTSANIRIDEDTINKSLIYNDEAGVDRKLTEKVLKVANKLLEEAKYFGSHVNYANRNGNVHYLTSVIMDEEKTDGVKENVFYPVVFAVHDPIDVQQKNAFSEKAYVAEIMIPDIKIKGDLGPLNSQQVRQTGVTPASAFTVSIEDVLNNVKADRVRYFDKEALKDKNIKLSVAQKDRAYLDAVKAGDMEAAQQMVDQAAEDAGYTIRAYHGTGRADRVGTVFRPERATSGPMAYFTDSREIAENYSRDKRDTSIAYDEDYGDYHTQFRYNLNGKDIPVSKLWDRLDWKSRQRIIEAAKHINFDEEMEDIIYDENAKYGPGGFTENELKYHKGNAIDTLIYVWLDSANLWNREQDFLKVLELAGIKGVKWNNPEAREEKVYDTYLKIQNPFDTGAMYTKEFLDDLKAWWEEQDQDQYTKESMGSDMWDKNDISVDEWADYGYEELEKGTTHNWTRIPDGVTAYLKEKGYDGIKDTGGKNGGDIHTVWVPFSSEQVKSAEAITRDDNGDIIPLSERFNEEKEDIRWSTRQQDIEVRRFMEGLDENSLQTQQEKTMLRQFKELYQAMKVSRLSVEEDTKKLRELEAKENPTAFDREEMRKARNRIENWTNKLSRLEAQMVQVTSDKGYAAMMYREGQKVKKLLSGRSMEEVRATIEALTRQGEKVDKEIQTRTQLIKELRDTLAVRKQATLLDDKSIERVTKLIQDEYGSKISKKELAQAITEIRLKMAGGKNISEDIANLAYRIVRGTEGTGSVYLDMLKGRTILLGKGQMEELKATNTGLDEIRKELAGTGIKIRAARNGEAGLDSNWDELCDMIPSLDREANEKDQLENLMQMVRTEKMSLSGADMYAGQMDDVEGFLKAMIATVGMNAPKDPEAMKILNRMNQLVNEMALGITKGAEELSAARTEINRLVDQGKLAMNKADSVQYGIEEMIRYNNALAEQSEAALWKQERAKLIYQLKSENTQALLQEQEKWKQRIAKDKTVREMMETNQQLRKRVHTNISRLWKLLRNETDLQNIPEHMKGLAREMIGIVVNNDLADRKVTGYAHEELVEMRRILDIMREQDGDFDESELQLINDEEAQSEVLDALADLEDGFGFYNASTGKDIVANLQGFRNALDRISEAVATITGVINAERSINIGDRRVAVEDAAAEVLYDMRRSRFKGETVGRGSRGINKAKEMIVSGNTTPVYFFKNLMNRGITKLWNEFRRGENRNGLEIQKARAFIRNLAEKTNYKEWADEKHQVKIGGRTVEMTVGNMMEIYAIWKREDNNKRHDPNMSSHLEGGGIYIQNEENTQGKLRKERADMRPMKIHNDDAVRIYNMLTDEQKEYMEEMVKYLSTDMSELGNETSMKMYGIKKYKEGYYFPMRVWDGVKSARSDKGISGTTENRAAHKGWSKRRKNNASNALVIGDFTQTAISHIVEMINYNTMAPAVENLNKVLNYQQAEQDAANEEGSVKRNVRIAFQEAYGKQALQYLEIFMKDLNGGVVQDKRKTLREALISTFRKNAVAGSLSVTLQQPLSYIRAAMMINPKYLAAAINPKYWKGSYKEMLEHSGVAVIKNMGRFDMNLGQSAKGYITPETKGNAYEKISDWLTKAPELADRMTWTRMWSAVKLEQHAEHPEMDMKSDEFLQLVADRFNDVMQRTQVYDSVLVKSANMRSTSYAMKLLTSFMAEPTLSLNVLADAVRNVKEEGGKKTLASAGATFILSAIMQAMFKGLMGSGRTPDEKKTWLENFLYKWEQNFISEANPMGLIPGYNDLIEVLKKGELKDDAMGALGKVKTALNKMKDMAENGKWLDYRSWEDSVFQIAQLFTNIPAKNIARDARAIYNWISQEPYAKRPTSAAVLRKQSEAARWSADDLMGTMNSWLGEAGFKTTNKAYYGRMFDAMQSGNEQEAEDIREYLQLAKGQDDSKIDSGLKTQAKEKMDAAESSQWMIDNDLMNGTSTLTSQYKAGDITREQYAKMMKEVDPKLTDNDVWWKIDQIDYQKETGADKAPTSYTYRLKDAMDKNSAAEIQKAVKDMMNHGRTQKQVLEATGDYKQAYLNGSSAEKRKIRDAIEKVYRAAGSTAEEADKKINKWK